MAKIAESVLKGRRAATAAANTGGGRSRRLRSVAKFKLTTAEARRTQSCAELMQEGNWIPLRSSASSAPLR